MPAPGEAYGLDRTGVTSAGGELKRLYLRRAWRNGGLGRLFDTAIAWQQADGPRVVWVGVWAHNHGAQRFHGRQSFEKVGEFGFQVGETVDREDVLRRTAESFSRADPRTFETPRGGS